MMEFRYQGEKNPFEGFHVGKDVGVVLGRKAGIDEAEVEILMLFEKDRSKGVKIHEIEAVFRKLKESK